MDIVDFLSFYIVFIFFRQLVYSVKSTIFALNNNVVTSPIEELEYSLERRCIMRKICSWPKAVSVRDYYRFRFGKWEYVNAYCRSYPSR